MPVEDPDVPVGRLADWPRPAGPEHYNADGRLKKRYYEKRLAELQEELGLGDRLVVMHSGNAGVAHGLDDLANRIRDHVRWANELCERLRAEPGVRIVTEPVLSLFSFAHERHTAADLAEAINRDGRIYLTAGDHDGEGMVRFVAGQFETTANDIDIAYRAIVEAAQRLDGSSP